MTHLHIVYVRGGLDEQGVGVMEESMTADLTCEAMSYSSGALQQDLTPVGSPGGALQNEFPWWFPWWFP